MKPIASPGSEPPEEQPHRTREWHGPLLSILLPVALVVLIAVLVWQSQVGAAQDAQLVQLDAVAADDDGRQQSGAMRNGEPAADFGLETVDGGQIALRDYRGKGVIVNFWATWCGPCRQEMPLLAEYADRQHDLVVVGVNVRESADQVRRFIDEFGIEFPVVLDSDGETMRLYRLFGLPATFFIDHDGMLRATVFGPITQEDVERLLPAILPAAP